MDPNLVRVQRVVSPGHAENEVELVAAPVEAMAARRMDRAEATLERALKEAGGISLAAPFADAAHQLASIEALRREAKVAERMAASKAE
jgi:hypothetical protein